MTFIEDGKEQNSVRTYPDEMRRNILLIEGRMGLQISKWMKVHVHFI